MWVEGCRVEGAGCRVYGLWCRVDYRIALHPSAVSGQLGVEVPRERAKHGRLLRGRREHLHPGNHIFSEFLMKLLNNFILLVTFTR